MYCFELVVDHLLVQIVQAVEVDAELLGQQLVVFEFPAFFFDILSEIDHSLGKPCIVHPIF